MTPMTPDTLASALLRVLASYGPCTQATLAVRAWRDDPVRWGLRGYEYPDASRVFVVVTKLVAKGKVVRRDGEVRVT